MNTSAVVAELIAHNQADIQPILQQCGGFFPFMSLIPHVQAVIETASKHPGDPAGAILDVVKHNEQSVREVLTMLGGVDGLIKLMPNLVNIYRTIDRTEHPVTAVLQHLTALKEVS